VRGAKKRLGALYDAIVVPLGQKDGGKPLIRRGLFLRVPNLG